MKTALALLICWHSASGAAAQSFEAWTAKGRKAAAAGDRASALESFNRALDAWKKSDGKGAKAKVLVARSEVHEKNGDLARAAKDLGEAIKLEPRSAAHHHRRGSLFLRQDKPSQAISDFYKATSLDLNRRDAYFERALAYERIGDLKFAREDYKTACRLGLKKACGLAKAPAEPKITPQPKVDEFALPPPKPPRTLGVEIQRNPAPKPKKLDYPACVAALDQCLEEGSSFGECVDRRPVCGPLPAQGCCPQSCVTLFQRRAADLGEAAAFRQVFDQSGGCVGAAKGSLRPAIRDLDPEPAAPEPVAPAPEPEPAPAPDEGQ